MGWSYIFIKTYGKTGVLGSMLIPPFNYKSSATLANFPPTLVGLFSVL